MSHHQSLLIEKLTSMSEKKAEVALELVMNLNDKGRSDKAVNLLNNLTGVKKDICENNLLNKDLVEFFPESSFKGQFLKAVNLVYLGVTKEKLVSEIHIPKAEYLFRMEQGKTQKEELSKKRQEVQVKQIEYQKKLFLDKILNPIQGDKSLLTYKILEKFINYQPFEQMTGTVGTLENILDFLQLNKKQKNKIQTEKNQELVFNKYQLIEQLKITPDEYKKWCLDNRIIVSFYKKIRRHGKEKQVPMHQYLDVSHIKDKIVEKWRKKDQAEVLKVQAKEAKKNILQRKINLAWSERAEKLKEEKYYVAKHDIGIWSKKLVLSVNLGEHKAICSTFYSQNFTHKNTLTYIQQFPKIIKKHFKELNLEKLAQEIDTHLHEALKTIPSNIDSIFREKLLDKLREVLLSGHPFQNLNKTLFKQIIHTSLTHLHHLEQTTQIRSELQLENYQAGFQIARDLKREFKIIVGPTNSGKTYEALEALKNAKSGVYLAPLRLLAMEVYDKLNRSGVLCSLHTGEEHIDVPGAQHVASTVEILNIQRPVEVAVIDEIQMIHDKQRGWAWTSALVGVPAEKIYVVGSKEGLASTTALLTHLKEKYEIQELSRKCPLEVLNHTVNLENIESGDVLIAFSRKNVLNLSQKLQKMGWSVSTIYGSLSPEVRRKQAENFNKGVSQVVVSTDAIGMGLNLPAKRIIFSTVEKFDGQVSRYLNSSECHQIAGRAGRFGLHEKGEVSAFDKKQLEYLRNKLSSPPYKGLHKIEIAPSLEHIKKLSQILNTEKLTPILSFFVNKIPIDHTLYKTANLEDPLQLASWADHFGTGLSLKERFYYSCAPVGVNKEDEFQYFQECLSKHNKGLSVDLFTLPGFVKKKNFSYLDEAEILSKKLSIYAWFSYKFPDTYLDKDHIAKYRELLSFYIENALKK